MIKIAVVDDEEYSAVKCRRIIDSIGNKDLQVDIFIDSKHFCDVIFNHKEPFDIIILDIDMPDISGFDIAKRLREDYPDIIIMFYTAHDQYVFKSFEFQPFRYIRKIAAEEELPFSLKCAIEKIDNSNDRYILVREDGIDKKIKISCILYCEKNGHHIKIIMFDSKEFRIRKTISELYNELYKYNFIHVNRGTIINMKYVESITRVEIVMEKEYRIPISRGNYKTIKSKFSEYIGGLIWQYFIG